MHAVGEQSLSLAGTGMEANLQGYEIFEDYLRGRKTFLKNLWGYESIEPFCRFFHDLHNASAY